MYDCVPENGGGFFEGACAPSNATAHLRDPPPPTLDSRTGSGRYSFSSSENGTFASLCAHPSVPSRGATTARRGLAASSPLPLLPVRCSGLPDPSHPAT